MFEYLHKNSLEISNSQYISCNHRANVVSQLIIIMEICCKTQKRKYLIMNYVTDKKGVDINVSSPNGSSNKIKYNKCLNVMLNKPSQNTMGIC